MWLLAANGNAPLSEGLLLLRFMPRTINSKKSFPTHKKVKSWLLNLNEKLLKLQPTILNDTELV